jgi:hypothetical protein
LGRVSDSRSPASQAFLAISTAPNSTAVASDTLRLLADALRAPDLRKIADRLAGDGRDGLSPREAPQAARSDPNYAMLKLYVRVTGRRLLGREPTPGEIQAAMAVADPASTAISESVRSVNRPRKQQVLIEMAAEESKGKRRRAAVIVAKRYARNPRDRQEIYNLSQKFRRWRR